MQANDGHGISDGGPTVIMGGAAPHCGRQVRDEAASGIHREADKGRVVVGFQGAAQTCPPRAEGGIRLEDRARRARYLSETAERVL